MMTDDTTRTLVWAVVFLFAIQSFATYSIVRMLVTGRPLFERREKPTC